MVVQAEAARAILGSDVLAACAALESIECTGREALTQMRHILSVLRAGAVPPDLSPQPGMAQLSALIQRSRAAGIPVELTASGEPRQLRPGADLVAYRVVEEILADENLANDQIMIALRFSPHELQLEVRCRTQTSFGWPSLSMRERVTICDGDIQLQHGQRDESQLLVRLPHVVRASMA